MNAALIIAAVVLGQPPSEQATDELTALAELLERSGEFAEAVDIYDQLRARAPDDAQLVLRQLTVCRRAPECSKRLPSILDDAVQASPGQVDLVHELFELLVERKEHDRALDLARVHLLMNPKDLSIHEARADLLFQLDRKKAFESAVREQLIAHPKVAGGWVTLGWIAFQAGRIDEAEGHLKTARACPLDPVLTTRLDELDNDLRAFRRGQRTNFRESTRWRDFEASLELRDEL